MMLASAYTYTALYNLHKYEEIIIKEEIAILWWTANKKILL